jgi:hypothetical protein
VRRFALYFSCVLRTIVQTTTGFSVIGLSSLNVPQVGSQTPLFVYVLFFISPVSFRRSGPSLEAETWTRTPSVALSATDKHSVSDMHMYVRKRSRHSWTLCEGLTIFVSQIRTQKFLLICESLLSVHLRLFREIFLISTFLLDMAPLDIIKSNLFFFSLHQVTRLYNL